MVVRYKFTLEDETMRFIGWVYLRFLRCLDFLDEHLIPDIKDIDPETIDWDRAIQQIYEEHNQRIQRQKDRERRDGI